MKQGITRREFLAGGCAAAMIGLLTAAGLQKKSARTTGPQLRIMTYGDSDEEACARLSQAMTDLLSDRLGCAIQVEQASVSNYSARLERQMLAGNAPDVFCAYQQGELTHFVNNDLVRPMNGLHQFYQESFSQLTDEDWACAQLNGTSFGIPARMGGSYQMAFVMRKDLCDKLGVEPESIRSMEQLHTLLMQVKKRWPDLCPVAPHFGTLDILLGEDRLCDSLGVLPDITTDSTRIENLYATEKYRWVCQRMHTWHLEGMIPSDAVQYEQDGAGLLATGNFFGYFTAYHPFTLRSAGRMAGTALTAAKLTDTRQMSTDQNQLIWCISRQTKLATKAIQLLSILFSEPEAANLLFYGVEGEDYRRVEENVFASCTSPAEHPVSSTLWCTANQFILADWQLDDGTLLTQEPVYAPVQESPAMGFVFDSAEVQTDVDNCKKVVRKYDPALRTGLLDPDIALCHFHEELTAAGIETVIAEKQRQLDSFLRNRELSRQISEQYDL